MSKKKRIPQYCLHKATGQAVVRINGKDKYLGAYGSAESYEKYDYWIGKLTTPKTPVMVTVNNHRGVTVAEVCLAYSEHIEETHGAAGLDLNESAARTKATTKALIEFGCGLTAGNFGPVKLKDFRETLIDKGLARSYINHVIDETQRIFRYAVTLEMIPPETSQALDMLPSLRAGRSKARETDPVKPVDDATVDATLEYLPPVVADMVRVQRLLGCRPGEACSMTPGEIDRSQDVWFYVPGKHKNAWRGKKRVIPIGPRAQAIIMAYLDRDDNEPLFSPSESRHLQLIDMRRRRKSPVQPSQKNRKLKSPKRKPGKRYNKNSYRQAVHRACKKAGLKPWNPNQLRHTAATRIRAEFDLETARTVLGHGSVSTTEIYAEQDTKKAAEVARKIG